MSTTNDDRLQDDDGQLSRLRAELLATQRELSLYKSIAEKMPHGLMLVVREDDGDALEFRHVWANAAAATMAEGAQLIGETAGEGWAAALSSVLPRICNEALLTGEAQSLEAHRFGDEAASSTVFDVSAFSVGMDGDAVAVICDDVTALHRSMAEVERSSAEQCDGSDARRGLRVDAGVDYKELFELSPDMQVSVDSGTARIRVCNQAVLEKTGYERSEIVGMPIFDIYHPDCLGDAKSAFEDLAVAGVVENRELYLRCKGGKKLPVLLNVRAVQDAGGNVLHSVSSWRDISQLKRLRNLEELTEKLRQSNDRFERVFECSPVSMIAVDTEGRIVLVNSETEKLFGYSRQELVGQPVETLLPASLRGTHEGHRRRFSMETESRKMGEGRELTALRKNGSLVPVEVALSPVVTSEGRWVLSAVADQTTLRENQRSLVERTEQLERSNADLEQFAYAASHDLQEPIRMVTSYTELLASQYEQALDDDGRRYMNYVVEGASRMRQLVDSLLLYSRVGSDAVETVPVDASEAVASALQNLVVKVRDSGATIEVEELSVVLCTPVYLMQVFQNLIGNAIKFCGEGPPQIYVRSECRGGFHVFEVSDNGIGIRPEYHQKIFTMFQRLHLREEYEGTGVGLSITKKIVERSGGQIWLTSEIGEGTTFFFSLPDAES